MNGFHPYVSLCESLTEEDIITTVHVPIVDLSIPDIDQLKDALTEMEERLKDGEKIYVHCWGGRGRAGLVACCLLAKAYKYPIKGT